MDKKAYWFFHQRYDIQKYHSLVLDTAAGEVLDFYWHSNRPSSINFASYQSFGRRP